MVFRVFLIAVFLVSFQLSGFSDEKDSIVNSVFTFIYNQQFNQANTLLAEQKEQLDPFYYEILKIDLYWWIYSTTRSKDDARNLNKLLKGFVKSDANGQSYKINQIIKKSYQLRYERKRYNLIGIVLLRSNINQLLSELNRDELPISGDKLKLFGLYVAIFQYFEKINPFSFQNYTSKQVVSLLKMEEYAREKDLIISTLAHYFLGRIYQNVERNPKKGQTHFAILSEKFPKNKLFVKYLTDCKRKL